MTLKGFSPFKSILKEVTDDNIRKNMKVEKYPIQVEE